MIAQSLGIKLPKNFSLKFKSLWQLDEKEKADIAKTVTDTVLGAQESGLVKSSTSLSELKQSAEVTGVWSNITDEEIDAADLLPPPGMGEVDPVTGLPKAPEAGAQPATPGTPAPAIAAPEVKEPVAPKEKAGTEVNPIMVEKGATEHINV